MSAKISPKLDFIFRFCNDIHEIRDFYTTILGFEETSFKDAEKGYIVYQCDGFQLIFNVDSRQANVFNEFANQPGHNLASLEVTSFAVSVPEEKFRKIYLKLKSQNFPALCPTPEWRGYWSYVVRDPMGVTIDIYYEPKEEPHEKHWID